MRKLIVLGIVSLLALTAIQVATASQDPSARKREFPTPLPTLAPFPGVMPEAVAAGQVAASPTRTPTAAPKKSPVPKGPAVKASPGADETEDADDEGAEASESPQPKVGICHLTGSKTNPYIFITVAQPAVKAHHAHGDIVDVASAAACPATAPTGGRGKGHGNGNGNGNGNARGGGDDQGEQEGD